MSAGTPEKLLKSRCRQWIKSIGGVYLPLSGWIAGTPDALIAHNGRLFLVEFKSPTGRLSPAQTALHQRLARAGCHVWIVRNLDELKEILNI